MDLSQTLRFLKQSRYSRRFLEQFSVLWKKGQVEIRDLSQADRQSWALSEHLRPEGGFELEFEGGVARRTIYVNERFEFELQSLLFFHEVVHLTDRTYFEQRRWVEKERQDQMQIIQDFAGRHGKHPKELLVSDLPRSVYRQLQKAVSLREKIAAEALVRTELRAGWALGRVVQELIQQVAGFRSKVDQWECDGFTLRGMETEDAIRKKYLSPV